VDIIQFEAYYCSYPKHRLLVLTADYNTQNTEYSVQH